MAPIVRLRVEIGKIRIWLDDTDTLEKQYHTHPRGRSYYIHVRSNVTSMSRKAAQVSIAFDLSTKMSETRQTDKKS